MKKLLTKKLTFSELSLGGKTVAILILALILFLVSPLLSMIYIVYFLPSMIAAKREYKFKYQILILNTFLGWTIVAWVGALIWATLPQKEEERNNTRQIVYWLIGILSLMYIAFILLLFLGII